jgi:hypothetical protein
MSGRDEYDLNDSDQDVTGDIGVSSGREGYSGGGHHDAPTGTRDTSEVRVDPDADAPPEQSRGGEETNPEGIEPKAGYPSLDPRSGD